MSKQIIDSFDMRINMPIDSRFVVESLTDIETPYEGLKTFQKSDKNFYRYRSGTWIIVYEDEDEINVLYPPYSCDNTGLIDCSTGLKKALEDGMTFGKKVLVPSGNYKLSNVVVPIIQGNIDVECSINTKFIIESTLLNKVLMFNSLDNYYSFKWKGGYFDVSNHPNGDGSGTSAWDCFDIMDRWNNVEILDVEIYGGINYTSCGGDSGICIVGKNILIENCTFTGIYDAAIYLTGDNKEKNGENALITNCKFYYCSVGVISKRKFLKYNVDNNYFYKCKNGIATGTAGIDFNSPTNLLAGTQNIIQNNNIEKCVQGILLSLSDDTIITGNRIIDFGLDLNENILITTRAIRLDGCKRTLISNNFIANISFNQNTSGIVGIMLSSRNFNSEYYHSTNILISNNTLYNLGVAIKEGDSNQSSKNIFNNIINCPFYYQLVNTLSSVIGSKVDEENIFINGKVDIGKGKTNYITIEGNITTEPPKINASGTDSGIDLSLNPKGSGLVRFGNFVNNSDTPITGYVQIKDSGGTIRKLATI